MGYSYIVDAHCDSLIHFVDKGWALKDPASGEQWDIKSAGQGGVGLQFMAAFIETKYKPDRSVQRGLQLLEGAHRFIDANSAQVFLVQDKAHIERMTPEVPAGLGVLLSVEGGEILGEDLFMLDIIYKLGVRSLGLTWNGRNALATGVGEGDATARLTAFGQEVVRRMNKLGMIVDVSHLNEGGFWHVLELSEQPIAATHSSAKALCNHPRNLTDQQLRALARHNGVVGVNFYPRFLREAGPVGQEDVLRHICHIAETAGVEAVGLGSDFDGITETPEGLAHVGDYACLRENLRRTGFSSREAELILGGNFRRLLLDVLN